MLSGHKTLQRVVFLRHSPSFLILYPLSKNIPNLKGLTRKELEDFAVSIGEQKYRGKQLFDWLYMKEISSFAEMSSLSKPLREKLSASAVIGSMKLVEKQESKSDHTIKYLFELQDGKRIESVLIPPRIAFKSADAKEEEEQQRLTLCVSTQVGCALDCSYCATARLGLVRNLEPFEIVGQVMLGREAARPDPLTNYVFKIGRAHV